MDIQFYYFFLTCMASILAKNEELPLCPTNIAFFPQNLPMHCRMPLNANIPSAPQSMGLAPLPPPLYQSPAPDKQANPVPVPVPPGGPVPYPFPAGPPAGPLPYPMPMPMPLPGPAHKLPVIVMPFYSPDPAYKKIPIKPKRPKHPVLPPDWPFDLQSKKPHYWQRRPHLPKHHSYNTYSGDEPETTEIYNEIHGLLPNGKYKHSKYYSYREIYGNHKNGGRRSNHDQKHSHKKTHKKSSRDLLTPVLQYVTKDGYVIFEKQISKDEAKDWLSMKKDDDDPNKEDTKDDSNKNKVSDPEEEKIVELKEHNSSEESNKEDKDKSKENENISIEDMNVTTERNHGHKKHHEHKLKDSSTS